MNSKIPIVKNFKSLFQKKIIFKKMISKKKVKIKMRYKWAPTTILIQASMI